MSGNGEKVIPMPVALTVLGGVAVVGCCLMLSSSKASVSNNAGSSSNSTFVSYRGSSGHTQADDSWKATAYSHLNAAEARGEYLAGVLDAGEAMIARQGMRYILNDLRGHLARAKLCCSQVRLAIDRGDRNEVQRLTTEAMNEMAEFRRKSEAASRLCDAASR